MKRMDGICEANLLVGELNDEVNVFGKLMRSGLTG